ncbi:MAG: hypothetical protein KF784_08690 [Fimbriimonadaceae bacterium]|nr:hypothetical protein [Fimbriimonadaceae bacterium]
MTSLLWVIVILLATILGGGVVAFKHLKALGEGQKSLDEKLSEQTSLLEMSSSAVSKLELHHTPSRLVSMTFEDFLKRASLDGAVFAEHPDLRLELVKDVTSALASTTSLGITLSSRFAAFAPHVEPLLQSDAAQLMMSQGQELAVAVQNGKSIGFARIVHPSAVQIACQGWLILVTGAHILSNHELSKSAKRIERGVVRLQDIDDADKMARLETCFEYLRWTRAPLDDYAKVNCRSVVDELRQLRIGWRNLLETEFRRIEDPTWIQAVLFPVKSTIEVALEVQRLEALLGRIELAFHLEAVALQMLDEPFLAHSFLTIVREKAGRLKQLASLLEKKWNEAEQRAKYEPPQMVTRLRELASDYAVSRDLMLILEPVALESNVSTLESGR